MDQYAIETDLNRFEVEQLKGEESQAAMKVLASDTFTPEAAPPGLSSGGVEDTLRTQGGVKNRDSDASLCVCEACGSVDLANGGWSQIYQIVSNIHRDHPAD